MNLKPQDVVVALKFVSDHSGYSEKATALGMSVSEVHGASKRALRVQLLVEQGGRIAPMDRNLTEFLVHGIRYVFPPDSDAYFDGSPKMGGSFPSLSSPGSTWSPPTPSIAWLRHPSAIASPSGQKPAAER
jgi:hypothetical protein